MPGQPAWTLTELLECNLPLCWAGGGDCNVGPAQFVDGPFFILKPIRAIACSFLKLKTCGAGQRFFFLESSFFFQQKRGSLVLVLCVCSCAKEKLQQRVYRKIVAAGFLYSIKKKKPDLYSRFG